MKELKRLAFMICIGCAAVPSIHAQDLHFSQFMNSPLVTNPANTGFIPEGDYRLGANFRNQWSSVMAIPYKTMSAFGDVQIAERDNSWVGVGGVIMRDVAGSGNLTSTKVYGSVAYHQMLNLGSLLSMGFNVGWSNKQINVTNLKFPDQFDGHFFDSHLPTSVALAANNISYLDIQAGLNYAFFPDERTYFNVGFSTMHINRPRESFFAEQPGISNRIPVRHTAFINGSFKLNDQWIINPNSYFSLQAKSYEWLLGANARYNLSGDGENILIGGLYYRNSDAIIPMVGLGYKDFVFTFTYDATISTLKNYNNSRGAFELSLVKEGLFDQYKGNRREAMCPSFKTY
ncbi:PorP/SprF family type IX secretion system membrane protein [Terrimonas sp. NA20]|uniref:PorP/SprF family type IX secretion system membrane protein n=1 Tax=Terrimonas ginsenosidimutans TaxID=2908004 RepID=A0ABS9KVP5_9BACT|nr:PorP/SprF family type IX secretion system membrane protein [Terrimonas ginsenosidimutans]MCG2616401.1 PorP/SprF family type IX secretion system membrane protein [Terrimonas ginsenosidimutans]